MKVKCKNGNFVERWRDYRRREIVVRTVDAAGNQIGDSDYCGCKSTAAFCFKQMVADNGGKADK